MALNKQTLKDSLYDDFSQSEVVLEEDSSNEAERAPSTYSYNVSPFKVTNNDVSNIEDSSRGKIRSTEYREEADVTNVTSDTDIDALIAATPLDTERNAAELLAAKLKEERNATVIADRVIQHLLDSMETEESANSIVVLRQMIEYLANRVLILSDDVGKLAAENKVLFDSLKSVTESVNNISDKLATVITATINSVGVTGSTASYTALLRANDVDADAFTEVSDNMADIEDDIEKVGYTSEIAEIVSNAEQVETDLKGKNFKTKLSAVKYDNSKGIK